jgi:hypothetical protein
MKDTTKRSVLRSMHIVFGIPIAVTSTARSKSFQTTLPLFDLSPFLRLYFRDFGCGKAISFDEVVRKGRREMTLPVPPIARKQLAPIASVILSYEVSLLLSRHLLSDSPAVRDH